MELLYLKKHYLEVYISDATHQLLTRRKKDSKDGSLQFLLRYFVKVQNGLHVLKRQYSYVSSTPYNRKSFIKLIWQAFFNIIQQQVPMTGSQYHQLLQLLCNDFPITLIEQVMNIITASSQTPVTFTEFIYTLQIIFYYQEFIEHVHNLFNSSEGSTSVIIVPPPNQTSQIIETLSLSHFTQLMQSLHEKVGSTQAWIVIPSLSSLLTVLQNCSTEVSFLQFLVHLSNCEQINKEIGILPSCELFLTTEPPVIGK